MVNQLMMPPLAICFIAFYVFALLAGFQASALQNIHSQLTESPINGTPGIHSQAKSSDVISSNTNSFYTHNSPTLTMCIDHYPPLQVVLENGNATGRNVELAKQFFTKLGYQLRFTADIPFIRCLQWLKEGEVDVMTGLLGSEQRHKDFHMFLYDDHTVKSFFVQKNKTKISKFNDLQGLNIAVVRGTSQFEAFDSASDNVFQKTFVNTLSAAFGMLSLGRVDAVVCTDYYGENIIRKHSDFQNILTKAEYQEVKGTKVYIALSKKSKYASNAQRFNKQAIAMFLSGEFKEILRKYQSTHSEEF